MIANVRTAAFLIAAALAVVAVCLVTCGTDDPAGDAVAVGARAPLPGDGDASTAPAARRHIARPASWGTVDPYDTGDRPVVPGRSSAGAGPDTAPAERPPNTGRVRFTMVQDGEPFVGGQVSFMSAEDWEEPTPWDGVTSSDGAYVGLPYTTALWPHFDPVLGARGPVTRFEQMRGVTNADGVIVVDVPADRPLVAFVHHGVSGIPLVENPHIVVAEGDEIEMTLEAARLRGVTGRCVDGDGRPLEGILVQAIAPLEERPLSRLTVTSATGEFALSVLGETATVRVRAAVSYAEHPLGIHDSEADVPPIPSETTVAGVVPGGPPIDIWMRPAPLVFIALLVPEGERPLRHLQIEGLAFDPRAAAWGRLGGPAYARSDGQPGGRRAVIALPRADAQRPLMLWSWGWTLTAVDPRGRDRVTVEISRGRRVGVRGAGWRTGDRLRVMAHCGSPGREIPCIWIDGPLGEVTAWSRHDAPVGAIEFHIVRGGVVVGRSARVPPGTEDADDVVIDLE